MPTKRKKREKDDGLAEQKVPKGRGKEKRILEKKKEKGKRDASFP